MQEHRAPDRACTSTPSPSVQSRGGGRAAAQSLTVAAQANDKKQNDDKDTPRIKMISRCPSLPPLNKQRGSAFRVKGRAPKKRRPR